MTVFCHRDTNVRRKPVTTKCGQRRLQNGREDNEAYHGGNTGESVERDAGAPQKIMNEHYRYPPFGVRFVTVRRRFAVALLLGSRFQITLRV
jgi:hypothetical protein